MEVCGKSMAVAGPANVIFLSTILGRDGPTAVHKCDWKCENERVCGNIASGQIFPLTPVEEQAVRGIRRKLEPENSPTDGYACKRRRDAQFHPSPFERCPFHGDIALFLVETGDALDDAGELKNTFVVSFLWIMWDQGRILSLPYPSMVTSMTMAPTRRA
ncbi:hypothetical protein CMV_016406 [Castanea mollissima]|uniref:Uncharacterized protein n=1 Tax=Castanea mollissima TaxID=60419 RepID=A0A8J4QZR2_9ROSI|nr:hypothetical protein CMV_016406 [Castanea mollissima]